MQKKLSENIAAWKTNHWESKLATLNAKDGSLWKFAKNLSSSYSSTGADLAGATTATNFSAEDFANHLEGVFSPNEGHDITNEFILHPEDEPGTSGSVATKNRIEKLGVCHG